MAMFPQFESMPGVPPVGGSTALLSFKAGKMKVVDKGGDKFHISPDLRKGSISLFKGPDDQLMHFAWKERPSGTVVDDIIILPEEAVYRKVDTGREGERVFLMEIAGNRRFFYWMQDKDPEKDEENMKKVNELTNSPPSDDAPAAINRGSSNSDMMELLSSMGGGAGTSGLGATAGAGSGLVSNEQGLNIQNLQSILQNMGFSPQEQAFATGDVTAATPSTGTSSAAAPAAATPAATTPADTTATPAPAAPAAADPDPAGSTASATPVAAAAAPSTPTPASAGNSGGGGSGETIPSGADGGAATAAQAGGEQAESGQGASGEGEGGDGKEDPAE